MRIVHVTPQYFPTIGGIVTIVKELCEHLHAKGFEVTVYSLDLSIRHQEKELINGVLVKRYGAIFGDPLFLPPVSFLKDLRNEDSGILHVHNLQNIFPLFVSLAKKSSQCLVLQPHYHRYGQTRFRHSLLLMYKYLVSPLILDRSSVIVANSKYEERILKEDFSSKENILTVPEGLPLGSLRSTNWSPEYPYRILHVGALKEYKKTDLLINAFKLLLERERKPLKLVIVGSGPEKQRLVKLVEELNLNDYVEWKSDLSRDALLAEYSKAKVFVLLSILESFSRVLNEALAIGIPTVAPINGAFSDLAKKGIVEGLRSEDPMEISKAISRAMMKGNKVVTRESDFNDISDYVDDMIAIYNTVTRRI